jgi:glycosyltransferase involved in cell wall biosynthesis
MPLADGAIGRTESEPDLELSIVLPAYNEADSLPHVLPEVVEQANELGLTYEVVVVDDGSRDGTAAIMHKMCSSVPNLRYLRLRRNLGKSAALDTALSRVRGRRVILMDADGQDDPRYLSTLLAALDDGLDLVTGRRAVRRDRFVKRSTSRVYNWFTSRVSGLPGTDFNSGFKAMGRDVADDLRLYGELHRYIPVLAHWAGFAVGEVDVNHRSRVRGTSKFGRARFWRGFLDLFTVKFITSYNRRPFHLFGGLGAILAALGSVLVGWMGVTKALGHDIGQRPALIAGVLFVVVGVQLASVGLLGELLVHHQFAAGSQTTVAEEWRGDDVAGHHSTAARR